MPGALQRESESTTRNRGGLAGWETLATGESHSNVRSSQHVMKVHAEEETDADGLSILDVENAVLTGRIAERQADRPKGDRKYVVRGRPLEGDDFQSRRPSSGRRAKSRS